MQTTVDLELAAARARAWREKAMDRERDRHAAALTKIQADFERRIAKIEKQIGKVGSR